MQQTQYFSIRAKLRVGLWQTVTENPMNAWTIMSRDPNKMPV